MPAMSSAVSLVEELGAGYLCEVKRWVGESGLRKAVLLPFCCIDSSAGSLFGAVVQTWQVAANRLLISMSEGDCPLILSGDRTTVRRNAFLRY